MYIKTVDNIKALPITQNYKSDKLHFPPFIRNQLVNSYDQPVLI